MLTNPTKTTVLGAQADVGVLSLLPTQVYCQV
jgi:hypothetical protein